MAASTSIIARLAVSGMILGTSVAMSSAQPYDFSAATALLTSELPQLQNRVAVIVRQDGRDIYRYQFGTIDYNTKSRLASFTKTLSAGVILALRDEGLLGLDERIGDALPLFEAEGLGDPTILDCFGMRHGIQTEVAYEIDRRYTLAQSVTLIGLNGTLQFPPASALAYEGIGMQVVGRIGELRTGQSWEQFARSRIFDRCDMPQSDYGQFSPNPAIAGGARSSAEETIRFAQMVMDGGLYDGVRVLSPASVEQLFTNSTYQLPVEATPWPETNPRYPYGQSPDYGFGTWIFAQNPASLHVEEIVGAGAWGSFIWLDRRRGLTAVLITDVPVGSRASSDASLGLFAIARVQADQHQAAGLAAWPQPSSVQLEWLGAAGATGYRVYASAAPIRNVYDLRAAQRLVQTTATDYLAPPVAYYAVTAVFDEHENLALTPQSNTRIAPVPCLGDVNCDRSVDFSDIDVFVSVLVGVETSECARVAADADADRDVDFDDIEFFVELLVAGAACP
jgi:CubicO group peptidase (beta-lactamase class C family)